MLTLVVVGTAAARNMDARLVEPDTADSDALADVDTGAADWLVLCDVDAVADSLVDTDADSLAEPDAADSDALASVDAADSLVLVDVVVDCDVLVDADVDSVADALVDSDALADVDAADSLVLCEIDSVADSLADPVLPEARTVLPSVARVCVFAAVTSYETGVLSAVMIYSYSSPRAAADRTGAIAVEIQPPGPGLQRWACFGERPYHRCRECKWRRVGLQRDSREPVNPAGSGPVAAPCASGSCRPSG